MRSDDLGGPGAPGGTGATAAVAEPAAFPSDAAVDPALARESRRRGRLIPALLLPAILMALAGGLFAVDRSAPAVAGGSAAAYLPPDGAAARYVDADSSVDAVEHARLIGVEGILTAPDPVAAAVLGAAGESGVTGSQLWRETFTTPDGSQYVDLYLVDDRGISEVAAWGGPVGFTFQPALLLMPSDAAPGKTWSSSGSAFGDGVLTYRAEYRASAPPENMSTGDGGKLDIAPDCLRVDGSLVIEQPGSGALLDSSGTSIWCPGEGRVLTTGEQNGEPVSSALAPPGTPLSAAAPAAGADPAGGGGSQGSAAAGSESGADDIPAAEPGDVTPLDAVASDPFFGDSVKQGAVTIPPARTDDGLVLLANDRGDDLQAWRLGDTGASLEWFAHPGGVLVSIAAVGDLTLAATSDRAVHAYDPLGRRLWTWRGAELALTAPLGVAGDPVIATRDGRVVRLSAADGAERWSADLGADARGPLALAGDTLVVADERGRLSGLDATSGAVRWRNDVGLVDALAASADGRAVYATSFDNEVLNLDPETGSTRWDDGVSGALRSVTASVDGVVVATDEETVGFGPAGEERWTVAGVDALPFVGAAAEPGSTVAVAGGVARRLSPDGEPVGEWSLPADAATDGAFVLADGPDVVLIDSLLRFWRMEAR